MSSAVTPTTTERSLLTLTEHAEALLAEMIFSGQLPPGTRIYPDETARQLNMSSIPVREALRGLAARGLVDAPARRGFRVRAADSKDFAETYSLRLLLDPYAVELAVPRMDAKAHRRIEACLERLETTILTEDVHSYYTDHRAFHLAIYEHCGSRWLLHIINMLWENSQRYQRMSTEPRGEPQQRVEEHRAIGRACIAGEAQTARNLMHDHLEHTRVVVAALLDGDAD